MDILKFIKEITVETLEGFENAIAPETHAQRLAKDKSEFPSLWLNEGNSSEEIIKPGEEL